MWLWVILCIVLATVLVYDARRYRPDFQILQTSVEKLTPELIRERYPVVIEDGVSDPTLLVRHRLAWTYRWMDPPASATGAGWVTVPSRYMVVWNGHNERDIRVRLAHPHTAKNTDPSYTEVILYPLQSIIVPVRWRVYSDMATYIRAWDYVSYFMPSPAPAPALSPSQATVSHADAVAGAQATSAPVSEVAIHSRGPS